MNSEYEVQELDIEYFRHGDQPLLAHVYRPVGDGPFPAVVDVHGGGWTAGDRFQDAAIDGPLARAGIVVVALDFRMPPEATYPAAVADVNLGIRWLKAHAAEFGTRPGLVGGFGQSSGGNLLLLAALRPHDPRYAALALPEGTAFDASVAYIVAGWPVADPLARFRMVVEKNNERLIAAHDAFWLNEEAMAEGNPQLIIERGEKVVLPPLFIAQGTSDSNLTPDMSDRFSAAYRAAGGMVQLEKFEGQPHGFIKAPLSPASAKALEMMVAFIVKQTAVEAPS